MQPGELVKFLKEEFVKSVKEESELSDNTKRFVRLNLALKGMYYKHSERKFGVKTVQYSECKLVGTSKLLFATIQKISNASSSNLPSHLLNFNKYNSN